MVAKRIRFYVIDAYQVALEADMGRRINTVMQTCFFAISGILPQDEAIAAIKHAVEKTYGRKGRRIAELNYRAIDKTLACLHEVPVPAEFAATDIRVPERTARRAASMTSSAS
jgi:pyruvate-ferredoxin/flavodoxin oxidoreductase